MRPLSRLWLLTLLSLTFLGCEATITLDPETLEKIADEADAPPPVVAPPGEVDGERLYATICASCHHPLPTSTILGKNVSDIGSAMARVPLMIANPAVQALTPVEIEAIAKVLNRSAVQEPAPQATGISFQVPLGNRWFLASKMKALFSRGNAAMNTTIDGFTTSLARVHGGTCNRMMPTCTGPEIESIGAQGAPTTNVLRVGYRIKACEAVLDNDLAVTNALGLVSLTSTSPRSPENLTKVFDLLTGVAPNTAVLSRFNEIETSLSAEPDLERWRVVLVLVCSSSLFEGF